MGPTSALDTNLRSRGPILFWIGLALAPLACGGGDDKEVDPPQPDIPPTIVFNAADPCTAQVPQPTDLFRDSSGIDAAATCGSVSDPIDAAIRGALADDGVPLDSEITIALGGEIDGDTATSTSATILLQRTGSGTTADDWQRVAHLVELEGTTLKIVPSVPLEAASYYVVVLTDAVKAKMRPIGQHLAVKALVGNSVIAAGTFEGLDAPTAERLERDRLRLAPAVSILERSMPPLARTQIRSIHGFSTSLGFGRAEKLITEYRDAVTAGKFAYAVTAGAEIMPADIYPAGTPPAYYQSVRAFLRGTIKVPKLLDAENHLRADWATAGETINVPFLISLPTGGNYAVAVYLPGLRGSKQTIREIAPSIAGAPRGATFGFDLRCHGDRSADASGVCKDERSASEVMMLVDQTPNGNPERTGPDGVPDNSGIGFFPGDARALRDTQLASVIEVVHVMETFQRGTMVLTAAGITSSSTDLHLIAHGHSAPVGVLAASLLRSPIRTVVLPAGGTGYKNLIESGPADQKTAFDRTLPQGVSAGNRSAYLTRLETTVLKAVSYEEAGELAKARYLTPSRGSERILLTHGAIAELVPQVARQTLIDSMELDEVSRVSAHRGDCDSFYLHTCRLGDNIAWGERAREQLATFIGSKGVTVLSPAQ